ncbi:MFS transporter [Streptomyces boncukensis]|uniref:MFS transporter n=1 Tax=Streptomyces boncukensis TaxID=2711219 RepID=A0A6G4WRN7_9ACTN|nr:MFS transporter [Streptomyces boncukensis]NGO67502.1 MFS transporter [Streptomyces boncukensis]
MTANEASGAGAEAGSVRLASARGRWVLGCSVLASGMALLDGTVVAIALPRLGRDLGAPLDVLQWTVNAYMLTLTALILLGGGLGDRFGRRRVFLTGVVWFALASALCATAPNGAVLIAARALQGVGGALLTPGSLALVQSTFRQEDRAKAVGAWSGLGGVAGAAGPFLGGWLVDGPGWRWIFLINLPLAAVVLLVAVRRVPESRDPAATGAFDSRGAALAALSLAGVTYALIEAAAGASPLPVALSAALAVACAAAFVLRERRTPHPMLPPAVFSSRLFTGINAVTLCLYAAIGGVFFILPVQLQTAAGYSAFKAGVATLPITLLMLLLSAPAGALATRVGPRLPLVLGPLITACGLLLLRRVSPDATSYAADVLPAVLIQGLGMSLFVAPLTATVLASVDVSRAGIASGVNNAAARAAQLLIVALLPLAVGLSEHAYTSPGAVDDAFGSAMLLCAALCAAGALLTWLLVPRTALEPAPDHEIAHPECTANLGVSAPPLEPGTPDER